MYLTKLEIFGFKSFAQKGIIKFDEGLTSIIGPNGCGKSNIVDAIRWVLGEQRPTILRCERMENLIFNGSNGRKPLNFSEVSMFVENNKQILPSEYNEIKITRRLYRSGESDYLINNEQVRLLDIINLFVDTGMGADAYSVIELKMVEQILSDNAEERRRLFEEAAGIKKYKQRRKSALRKLDTSRQELVRLEDIISEVQKTVNSLARQVGKARRYHEYKERLRENELLLIKLKIRAHDADLQPLEVEFQQISATKEILTKDVLTQEAQIEKLKADTIETQNTFREVAQKLQEEDQSIQELQNEKQLQQQKIDSTNEIIKTSIKEIQEQERKKEQMTEEMKILHEQTEKAKNEITVLQEEYRESTDQHARAENNYQLIKGEYQQFVKENIEKFKKSTSDKDLFQKTIFQKENIQSSLEKNKPQLGILNQKLKEKEEAQKGLKTKIEELSQNRINIQNEIENLNNELLDIKEKQDDAYAQIIQEEGQLEKLRNKKAFLARLIDSYEGFSEGVQHVMSKKSEFEGLVDTIANLVDTDDKYRVALESYLSELSTYLVVENIDAARKILNHIRANEKGRLHLISLELLNEFKSSDTTPGINGNMISLKEVVRYDQSFENLFNVLLNDVFIVPNLDAAFEMRAKHQHLTYITKEGEILRDWGNLTGGKFNKEFNLLGRRAEYEEISTKFEDLKSHVQSLNKSLSEISSGLKTCEESYSQKISELKEIEKEISPLEMELKSGEYELAHLQGSINELSRDVQDLEKKQSELIEIENQLLPKIQVENEKIYSYQHQENEIINNQRNSEEKLKAITSTKQNLQIELINRIAIEKEQKQKIDFIEKNSLEIENFINQRQQYIKDCEVQIQILKQRKDENENLLDLKYQQRDEIENLKNELEKSLRELQSSLQAEEHDLKKKQRQWNEARDRIQQLELQTKELQVKISGLKEQLVQNYGSEATQFNLEDLDQALAINHVQEQAEVFQNKLDGLGDVNPLAIKEHEREKERLDFLRRQKADIVSAEEQLLETIHKLNTTARKEFMITFENIRKNFQKVFKEFFENGEADLVLVESRDPLEANIDISINLKGKQLNTLSLLSAGEKTLTAISMLFAIYLVKPSPFCILDEVDAPLDDVNISRFTHALNQFSKDTQFILVTHNKRTIEATKSLYGITMEEPGVSKIVSVRLD
jgi:chromosome segregation protein